MSSKTITQNDLTNILNEIFPATSDDMTPAQIEDFVQSLNAVATSSVDYIVEQGVSGIWTYRKWNSGIAECWGTYETTATYSAATSSGGYRVILSNIGFPAIFTAAPSATASHNGSSSHYWGVVSNVNTGLSELSVALDRGSAVTNGAVRITFNLKGTWK